MSAWAQELKLDSNTENHQQRRCYSSAIQLENRLFNSDMDFYNLPVSGTVTLGYRWFDLPRNNTDYTPLKVIAVSAAEAKYWIVAYTVLVTLIFAGVARLAVDLVLAFLPINSDNRLVMLVAFYNSNTPSTAVVLMSNYCCRAFFRAKADWRTLRYALILMAVAGALIGTNLAAKFLVSANQLVMRQAARADPSALFYPNFFVANTTGELLDEVKPIRGSAGFQALGRYETSRRNLANRVHMVPGVLPEDDGRPMAQYNYSYHITGYEMGLQDAPGLKYNVAGFCKTDYSIYNNTDDLDIWNYWPSWKGYQDQYSPRSEQLMPPFLSLSKNPDQSSATIFNKSSIIKNGFMFGLTPHTSFRLTTTENLDDPWYSTELNPDSNTTKFGRNWRVKRGRPALRCVQNDTFTLSRHTVYHVDDLKDLRGLKLSTLLRDDVFPFELALPPIAQLTLNLGVNNLASSLYYYPPSQSFTADKASLTEDLKKLVSVSFLYSREVARNLFLVYSTLDRKGLNNLAEVNGTVPYAYADVILESSEVAALSVKVLLITPIVCVLIWILVLMTHFIVGIIAKTDNSDNSDNSHSAGNLGPLARLELLTIRLHATQLYRSWDEHLHGTKWSGESTKAPLIEVSQNDTGIESGLQSAGKPSVLSKLVPVKSNTQEDVRCTGVEASVGSSSPAPEKGATVRVKSVAEPSETPQHDLGMTQETNPNSGRGPESCVSRSDVHTDWNVSNHWVSLCTRVLIIANTPI